MSWTCRLRLSLALKPIHCLMDLRYLRATARKTANYGYRAAHAARAHKRHSRTVRWPLMDTNEFYHFVALRLSKSNTPSVGAAVRLPLPACLPAGSGFAPEQNFSTECVKPPRANRPSFQRSKTMLEPLHPLAASMFAAVPSIVTNLASMPLLDVCH